MVIHFTSTFFKNFRERPPALRAVRALVIDTRKEIPTIGISSKPCHKNRGHFKQYNGISTERPKNQPI